jgi:hypothetical protein
VEVLAAGAVVAKAIAVVIQAGLCLVVFVDVYFLAELGGPVREAALGKL